MIYFFKIVINSFISKPLIIQNYLQKAYIKITISSKYNYNNNHHIYKKILDGDCFPLFVT